MLFTWLYAVACALQIYFDFSGYSDMAVGLGRIFGFHFRKLPLPSSPAASRFWRRWHISLGSWFRDYVYIPLGGSRCSRSRWLLNVFLVWGLTGLAQGGVEFRAVGPVFRRPAGGGGCGTATGWKDPALKKHLAPCSPCWR